MVVEVELRHHTRASESQAQAPASASFCLEEHGVDGIQLIGVAVSRCYGTETVSPTVGTLLRNVFPAARVLSMSVRASPSVLVSVDNLLEAGHCRVSLFDESRSAAGATTVSSQPKSFNLAESRRFYDLAYMASQKGCDRALCVPLVWNRRWQIIVSIALQSCVDCKELIAALQESNGTSSLPCLGSITLGFHSSEVKDEQRDLLHLLLLAAATSPKILFDGLELLSDMALTLGVTKYGWQYDYMPGWGFVECDEQTQLEQRASSNLAPMASDPSPRGRQQKEPNCSTQSRSLNDNSRSGNGDDPPPPSSSIIIPQEWADDDAVSGKPVRLASAQEIPAGKTHPQVKLTAARASPGSESDSRKEPQSTTLKHAGQTSGAHTGRMPNFTQDTSSSSDKQAAMAAWQESREQCGTKEQPGKECAAGASEGCVGGDMCDDVGDAGVESRQGGFEGSAGAGEAVFPPADKDGEGPEEFQKPAASKSASQPTMLRSQDMRMHPWFLRFFSRSMEQRFLMHVATQQAVLDISMAVLDLATLAALLTPWRDVQYRALIAVAIFLAGYRLTLLLTHRRCRFLRWREGFVVTSILLCWFLYQTSHPVLKAAASFTPAAAQLLPLPLLWVCKVRSFVMLLMLMSMMTLHLFQCCPEDEEQCSLTAVGCKLLVVAGGVGVAHILERASRRSYVKLEVLQ